MRENLLDLRVGEGVVDVGDGPIHDVGTEEVLRARRELLAVVGDVRAGGLSEDDALPRLGRDRGDLRAAVSFVQRPGSLGGGLGRAKGRPSGPRGNVLIPMRPSAFFQVTASRKAFVKMAAFCLAEMM